MMVRLGEMRASEGRVSGVWRTELSTPPNIIKLREAQKRLPGMCATISPHDFYREKEGDYGA